MMNELDKNIKKLFINLITSGTKYLINMTRSQLNYKINNKYVSISIFDHKISENLSNSYMTLEGGVTGIPYRDSDGNYNFTVNIENRCYFVPELDRTEKALILNEIEQIFKKRETELIDSLLSEFNEKD